MVAGKGPSLLGIIQWHQINALVTPPTINSKGITENKEVADKVEALVNGFPDMFNYNLGEIHPFKARLVLWEPSPFL